MAWLLSPIIRYVLSALAILGATFGAYQWAKSKGRQAEQMKQQRKENAYIKEQARIGARPRSNDELLKRLRKHSF